MYSSSLILTSFFFFFNDTATTEIYTLSLHDALPISPHRQHDLRAGAGRGVSGHPLRHRAADHRARRCGDPCRARSEEHTSELQSPCNLVCRLLLEKKKKYNTTNYKSTYIHDYSRIY